MANGGLVHMLWEWHKDERCHWDTQCGIGWGSRDNTNRERMPKTTSKPVSCLGCIEKHLRNGWSW